MVRGKRSGTIFDERTTLGLGPAELLGRFAATRDEAAFAALVAQHGPMVLATCRRLLGHGLDADDAFQATFLVLARRAGSIADPDRLAPWLHGVARRVSVRARTVAARRRAFEGEPAEDELQVVAPAPPRDDLLDLRAILDEELARLPAKYRAPLVLCYLEGLTHDEAAGQLKWPVGTVRSRLAGGRDRLRSRLARRGLDPAGALVPVALPVVPPTLLRIAVRGATGVGVAPAHVVLLARGVSLAMTLASPKTLTLALLLGLTLGSAAVLAHAPGGGPDPATPMITQEPAPATRPPIPQRLPAEYPLTVTGQALDPDGKPIANARIFLASCGGNAYQRLAETRTDATGAYRFEKVLLPIRPDGFNDKGPPARGYFEVFGQAEGFGFTWRPRKEIALPQPNLIRNAPVDPPDWYQPGDPIVLDLTFPPPARLAGRITNDQGGPLAGASVWLRSCDLASASTIKGGTEFASLSATDSVPSEWTRRSTDASGNFAFEGFPPNRRFIIDIRPQGFPQRQVMAFTTAGPVPDVQGWTVFTGPIDLVFVMPREVACRVVTGDTGQPAPRVRFGVAGAVQEASVTDADGRGRFALPPGDYTYELLPAIGTPYLVTEGKLTVPADGPIPPVAATLRPAVVLDVEVIDAATGAPIAGVDLWRADPPAPGQAALGQRELYFRSYEASTQICHVERPRTDAAGKLRALIEPGPHQVGVGQTQLPRGWQPVNWVGEAIDGQPGETIPLQFLLRRR